MEWQARELEGFVRSFTTYTFNSCGCLRRKAFGELGAAFGVRGLFALAAMLVAAGGSVPVAAQSVEFFGAFQSYNQSIAKNAQGLVANAQGTIYLSGSHALGYVGVDVNGAPIASEESTLNPSTNQGQVMGMAIDASNNIFRADNDSPGSNAPAVEMFTYVDPTTFTMSYIGSGWSRPSSVTTDSRSNVYVLDAGVGTIFKLMLSGGIYTPTPLFTNDALINATGLSIDSAGNFYAASGSNYGYTSLGISASPGVYKFIHNGDGSYTPTTIGSGWVSPSATTVDEAGNVWVVDCGLAVNCGAGTINLLVLANGTYTQTPPQSISGIRTLMITQAGKLYGFAYTDGGLSNAQIWTGGTPPHNLGTYNVGTAAPTVTVTVDFTSAATAGGFNVTTQGSSAGDFQATGTTCAAGSFLASQSCTIQVTFTPQAPGIRTGALVVTDSGGNVIGTNYFYGVGLAPSIAFLPRTFSTPIPSGAGIREPFGTALDQAGNLYFTDWSLDTLTKFAAGSTTPTVLDSTLNRPAGMTVDGAGNLWVAECGNDDIVLQTLTGPGTYARSVPFTSIGGCPYDVAVDGSGNVYIALVGAGDVVKETLTNGSYVQSVVVSDLSIPMAVAVDSSSNVYVADTGNHQVLKETPSGSGYVNTVLASSETMVANTALKDPAGLAIDPNGNIYISDPQNQRIVKATPSNGAFIQLLAPGMIAPAGLALDAAGDLYIADQSGPAIEELNVSTAPTFHFADTAAGSASLDSPKRTILFNYGNADLIISAITIPPAPFSSDASTQCALNSETLTANTGCTLGIDFTPTSGVLYGGAVTLTDNNLNGTDVTQGIGVSGAGLSAVITLSPASETLPPGTMGIAYSQTFTATGGTGNYTFALTGTLPAGLSLSASGLLAGTPTTPYAGWEFGVTATDNSPSPGPYTSSNQNYWLPIGVPVLVLSLGPLPDGAVGIPYSQSLPVSGGSGSYTYAVTAGSLPEWMSLNASTGLLSGTPIVAGPISSFTITATDTINSASKGQPYTPTIYAVASAAPAQTAGSSSIGSAAPIMTLTFTFNVPATVVSINVVTQGAANQDFTNADAGTCTGAHGASSTCAVDVTFTPQFAGARYGAVLLEDASGDVLGTALIDGIGSGPQIDFGAGTASAAALAPTANALALGKPTGIAMDGAGDLFIADIENNRVVEMLAGGGATLSIAPIVDGRPLHKPGGLVVDGAGNLFIADIYNWRVVEVPAGGGAAIAIAPTVDGTPLNNPIDIALDGVGNLFIADTWNNRIVEVSASGAVTAIAPTVNDTTLTRPSGIAVDSIGNLFISDTLNARVVEVPSNGGAAMSIAPTVNGTPLNHPSGITVDGAGDLFIADTFNNRVVKVPGDGSAATAFAPAANGATLVQPNGIALDGAGDLFVSDHGNRRVMELQRSLPPILSFASTAVGVKSSDSPQFVAVENTGNAPLTFSGLSTVTDFPLDGSGPGVCTSTTSLAAGARCTLPIDFLPVTAGARNGTLALIDNSLGGNSVTQNITLSGAAIQATPTLTWPTASAIIYGQTLASSTLSGGTSTPAGTFTWTTASTAPVAGITSESVTFIPTDTVDYDSATGTASVTVNKATAVVTLAGLTQTYTGSAFAATATTTPGSLGVSLTYNGSSTPPTAAGAYAVVGTINDTNYQGTATETMTISKAAATATLAGLSQTYTGSALAATATTSPAGLMVLLTYNGSSTAPTAAGSYAVAGTINDTNYQGAASGTMTISQAAAAVTLSRLSQIYTASALAATATTNPVGLNVSLTYNGSSIVPTSAGSYAVVGTINNPNYRGTASGTLVIGAAATAVSIAASANPAPLMGFGTLTATVSSAAGTPPGEVSFLDGTTLLGSATVLGGVATFPTATLVTGTHSITAIYVATSNFTGSSSNPLALSVVDLSLGNTSNGGGGSTGDSQTTTPGGSASYTVALAPSAGTTFPSPIVLFVTGMPLGATATLGTPGWTEQSPTVWTLPANQPVSNISLKFQMPAQMAAAEPGDGPASKLPLLAVGLLLLPFARKWRKAGKRTSGWLCLLLIAVGITAATGATGCGSSSQPPQTYTIKVSVTAGALIHTTQLTLTVK